jgi:hypothetical protein
MANEPESRERVCPHAHPTIADAIRCAQSSMGIVLGQKLRPYWGTTKYNAGLIVGWQTSSRKRWRLDYDVKLGGKGPHVNEENFEMPPHLQKVCHLIDPPAVSGELMVYLQWKKWTSAGDVEK